MRLLLVALAALVLVPAAFAGPGLRVGAVEDAAVWQNPDAEMDLAKLAGFDSIRVTAQWSNGMTILPAGQVSRLQRAAIAASMRGLNPIVSIYNVNGASTPNDPSSRAQFVEFAKSTVRSLPWASTFIVGNEPNSSVYWQPQFDAAGGDAAAQSYAQLLAATYDAIKQTRPTATVIGGALDSHGTDDPANRPSHSPTAFIRDLGASYRATGRAAPLMDVFDEHVYGDTSALPPSMPHTGGTAITEGDYGKLVALLGKAFDGTAQKGSTLPIVYGEYGVESSVPAAKASLYTGSETAKTVDETTQGAYYAEAFRLALCQPNVIGIMVFHVVDESALGAWQSGPFYPDRSPKSSFQAIHDAAVAARAGTAAACPDRTAPSVAVSTANGAVAATASDAVGVGKLSLYVNGAPAEVRYAAPYAFSWLPKRAGRYTLDVRAADASGNVGRAIVTVAATHPRRVDAAHPSRWQFRRVRAVHARAPQRPARRPRAAHAAPGK
jgi:Bacterial Ig domain